MWRNHDFKNIEKVPAESMRGGNGTIYLQKVLDVEKPVKMYAKITLPPMTSIGYHMHVGDQEFIYVLKGELDLVKDGVASKLKAGEFDYTKANFEHGITNNTSEDVEILAIVTEV
jgi:quercetin dioxygenase-like cupin family protein